MKPYITSPQNLVCIRINRDRWAHPKVSESVGLAGSPIEICDQFPGEADVAFVDYKALKESYYDIIDYIPYAVLHILM